jgi:para-nitrobenzyl esterase
MKPFVVMCVALAAIPASAADSGPIVTVTGGQVRGAMLDKGGAVFKGIPYAQPPVGELRWREPMPLRPWTGVRDATAFGPLCTQVQNSSPNAARISNAQLSQEDCLYLNVWTPEWHGKPQKPVMVFIPGGGNLGGGSSEATYDGESLARHGVVLVSLNYRLGPFGFFSHPALTRESPHHASGNQGILDQIAALRWVRANAARFGGDANEVTIFGESAGSLDVSVLMTSPLSQGLFRRAIAQSGSVVELGDPLTLPQAEKRGEMAAANWKIPAGASVKDLRAVSAADILKAEPDYSVAFSTTFPNAGITVDRYVLPLAPAEVFAKGKEHHVALLHGSNSRDRLPPIPSPKDLKKAIEEAYGPIAGRAEALYVGGVDPVYGTPANQWAGDTSFRCPAVEQLAWHAAAGNPAYQYEFARVSPGREAYGAIHAAELPYVFGNLDRPLVIPGLPAQVANAVDMQVSGAMQQYWTNFAKTGDPNSVQLPVWPKFDTSSRAYMQFRDTGPVAKEGLRRAYCDLFMENVDRLKVDRLMAK